jgi:glycolate oxidase FAD binding subunit
MGEALAPQCAEDIVDIVADAIREGDKLAIVGGGSKAAIGAPVQARALALGGLRGVVDYDPAELVLTVRPGTPLAEIQEMVAQSGQMLAFEPFDHGPIFGQPQGAATIGGIVAAGVSGSQRLSAGAARDHLLGFRAVSGRGELFVAGARVVKNVTGFDLPKLAAGSWGRLFAMTELTLKVLPRPRESVTRVLFGLDAGRAVLAMARAMGSQAEVAAAAYLPAGLHGGPSATLLRVQGFGPSVSARCRMLDTLLADFGAVATLAPDEAHAAWDALRTLAPLGQQAPLWRVNLPPTQAARVIDALPPEAPFLLDWAGGLIWLACDIDPGTLRARASDAGGHAMLVRADECLRAAVSAFHPQPRGVAALEERVRRAFDPAGIFETGRF